MPYPNSPLGDFSRFERIATNAKDLAQPQQINHLLNQLELIHAGRESNPAWCEEYLAMISRIYEIVGYETTLVTLEKALQENETMKGTAFGKKKKTKGPNARQKAISRIQREYGNNVTVSPFMNEGIPRLATAHVLGGEFLDKVGTDKTRNALLQVFSEQPDTTELAELQEAVERAAEADRLHTTPEKFAAAMQPQKVSVRIEANMPRILDTTGYAMIEKLLDSHVRTLMRFMLNPDDCEKTPKQTDQKVVEERCKIFCAKFINVFERPPTEFEIRRVIYPWTSANAESADLNRVIQDKIVFDQSTYLTA